jgi:hypothetical protein
MRRGKAIRRNPAATLISNMFCEDDTLTVQRMVLYHVMIWKTRTQVPGGGGEDGRKVDHEGVGIRG